MNPTKILWLQVFAVCSTVLGFVWAATEWTAWQLAFQPQLGPPWFSLFGCPIYLPPVFFWWWFAFDAYAHGIFVTGGFIAGAGGVAAFVGRRHVRLARAGGEEGHDLWLGPLGRRTRNPQSWPPSS
jgi:type IV secretion system protein VirD4